MLDREKFRNVDYAFRALDESWALYGKGIKWISPQHRRDSYTDSNETSIYLKSLKDERIKAIEALLTTDIEQLFSGRADVWMVLEFVGESFHVALPVELFRTGKSESLAQIDLQLQASTGSEQTLSLASSWLEDCVANHPQCRPIYPDIHWLPTRLVFLGTTSHPQLRLVLGNNLSSDTTYVTLSHCWGASTRPTSNSSSFAALSHNLPLDMFSQTMLDAVHIARHLQYQYIWIDSLCIFQEDAKDWETESAMMSKVYGFSSCTIAVACSTDGTQGIFRHRNQYRIRPFKIANPFDRASNHAFQIMSQYLGSIYQDCVKQSVWHDRSWVFQERLLSQRMIIFTEDQVLWTCQKIQAGESCPQGKTSQCFIDRFESFEVEKLRLRSMFTKRAMHWGDDEASPWHVIVSGYTKTKTTRASDRLIALQGIADRIAQEVSCQYLYGLWCNETLPGYLLWHILPTDISSQPLEYRCPSWSWGGVDGPVQFYQDFYLYNFRYVQEHKPDIYQAEDVDLFATQPIPIRIKAPAFTIFLEVSMRDRSFNLHRSDPRLQKGETKSLASLDVCSTIAVRGLGMSLLSQRSPSIQSEASEFCDENSKADDPQSQHRLSSPQGEKSSRMSRWMHQVNGLISKQPKRRPRPHRRESSPPPARRTPKGLKTFRTRSMDDGTAYGNDFERFLLGVKDPKQRPDPTILKAVCCLDTTSHNDGVCPVTCLVLASSASRGKFFGLLLRQGPGRFADDQTSDRQDLPRLQRVGTFSCVDTDPIFVDLEKQTRELLLI